MAAAAYLLAPYVLYDVYFRGNLAESVALPILPLVLWAFGRLVRSGQARYLALGAVSLALLVLAHQVIESPITLRTARRQERRIGSQLVFQPV